jgi:hypothetical protein
MANYLLGGGEEANSKKKWLIGYPHTNTKSDPKGCQGIQIVVLGYYICKILRN